MADEQRPLQNLNAIHELVNNVDSGPRNDQVGDQGRDIQAEAHTNVQDDARGGFEKEQAEPKARPEVSA